MKSGARARRVEWRGETAAAARADLFEMRCPLARMLVRSSGGRGWSCSALRSPMEENQCGQTWISRDGPRLADRPNAEQHRGAPRLSSGSWDATQSCSRRPRFRTCTKSCKRALCMPYAVVHGDCGPRESDPAVAGGAQAARVRENCDLANLALLGSNIRSLQLARALPDNQLLPQSQPAVRCSADSAFLSASSWETARRARRSVGLNLSIHHTTSASAAHTAH